MGSLGWPEILIILVIALIIFGPRKLPELGKTLGQSLAQFRRASEDFKRTWEEEVEIEKRKLDAPPPSAVDYSSTTEPYEGHDFSLTGSHEDTTSQDPEHNEATDRAAAGVATDGVPMYFPNEGEPAEAPDHAAEISEKTAPALVEKSHNDEAKHDLA